MINQAVVNTTRNQTGRHFYHMVSLYLPGSITVMGMAINYPRVTDGLVSFNSMSVTPSFQVPHITKMLYFHRCRRRLPANVCVSHVTHRFEDKNILLHAMCYLILHDVLSGETATSISYISLIRYKLEYSCSVWDPHLRKDIHQLEMVQRRVARFIKPDYSYDSSVSQMLKDLDLSSLENRSKMNKLTLLYKIKDNLLCSPLSKQMVTLNELTHALVTPAGIIS